MATTRLRKTFAYPTENDSEDEAHLDEEHQEALITSLAQKDAQNTTLYRNLFLLIPLTTLLFSAYNFLSAPKPQDRMIALLGVTCTAATVYILLFMPLPALGAESEGKRRREGMLFRAEGAKGPLEKYFVYLVGLLAAMLGLLAGVMCVRGRGEEALGVGLPAGVFLAVLGVRHVLRPVGVGGLEGLRYGFKGA